MSLTGLCLLFEAVTLLQNKNKRPKRRNNYEGLYLFKPIYLQSLIHFSKTFFNRNLAWWCLINWVEHMGGKKKVTELLFLFYWSLLIMELVGFFLSFVFIQISNKGFYYRLSLLRPSGKVFYVIWAFWIKMPQYMKCWLSFFLLFWCSLKPNGSVIVHKYCQSLCYWDALLFSSVSSKQRKRIICEKAPLGKYFMSVMGQWESLLALFWLGQTSVWACQNWFCRGSHNSGTERKTMGL